MYVCIYILYMYVYIYMYIYTYIHICIYICIYIYIHALLFLPHIPRVEHSVSITHRFNTTLNICRKTHAYMFFPTRNYFFIHSLTLIQFTQQPQANVHNNSIFFLATHTTIPHTYQSRCFNTPPNSRAQMHKSNPPPHTQYFPTCIIVLFQYTQHPQANVLSNAYAHMICLFASICGSVRQ